MTVGNLSNRAVEVIHGANEGTFALAGARVASVRSSLVEVFNIPSEAIALVNGAQVDMGYILQGKDTLEFVKPAGRKGINRPFTKTDILREYAGYPQDVFDDLFRSFRHHDTNGKGEPIWNEQLLDEWLRNRYANEKPDDGKDRVIPPSSVRIDGKVYRDFGKKQWQLLEAIINKPSVESGIVIEHVYGHDADDRENALTQLIKRVNQKLVKQDCPYTVSEENEFVSLTK